MALPNGNIGGLASEGDANELQSLYQSYFPGQTLSPADIDYYTKAGGVNALLQEFEGLKPIGQPTINVQPASPPPLADNWMSGVIFDQSKLPANFDWQNYLTRYSDLGAAGIDTPLEAQRHYALYGATEGRQFAPEVVNQDAVKNLYQSVLGREADPGGLAYWASQFGSDVSPEEEAAFRQASQAEIAARTPAGGLSSLEAATTTGTSAEALAQPAAAAGSDTAKTDEPTPFKFEEGALTNPFQGQTGSEFLDFLNEITGYGQSNLYREYFRTNPNAYYNTPTGQFIANTLSATTTDLQGFKDDKGNQYVYIAGATGGPDRERMAQTYLVQGDQLVPLGEPKYYKGESRDTGWKQAAVMFASMLAPGISEALGGALSGGALTGTAASTLGTGAVNFATNILTGADPIDALKSAALSTGATFVGNQVASMLPAEVGAVGKQAVTQLITTGKINPAALATATGMDYAAGALAAETGIDKATASKLITAGYQAFQGNELGALSTLIKTDKPSSTVQPGTGNVIDEYNVVSGGLSASANPAEDELIGQQQRVIAANQAISDYLGPGNDLSREGLVGQLTNLVGAEQANTLAAQADTAINQRRVSADVINRYSQVDPEFGTPALARNVAVKELEAAGFDTAQANDILDGVDRQVAAARTAALNKAAQDQAAINAGAGEFAGADARAAIAAGAGEFVDTRASQAVLDSISNAKTFNDAFATARTAFGPGSTFNWQGKLYSTATVEENPALSGKPILTTNAFNNTIQDGDIASRLNMGLDATDVRSMINEWNSATDARRLELLRNPAYAGIKAIYDEKSSTRQLSPSEIASTIRSGASGSISATPESAWVLGARDLAEAIQDTVALVTGEPGNTAAILNRAGGQMLQAVGGVSSTLGATNLGRELTLAGKTIEEIGESTSTYAGTQQQIINNINAQSNWGDKLITAGKSVFNNLGAVADWVATEALQEGPALLAFGAVRTGKAAASLLTDGLETMGFAWNDARAAALESGKSITEANKLADKAAWLSGATTLAVAGVLDDRAIKALQDFKAGRITQETAKEAIGGALDEGGTQAIIQAVATGKLDPNAIGTAAVLGGMIESKTSGALTTIGQGAYDNATAVDNISQQLTSGVDTTTALSGSINSALNSGASSTGAINSTLVGALNNNIDPVVAVSSTFTGALNNNLNANTAASTVISSAIANDISPATAVSSVIDSTLNNGNVNSLTIASTATSTAIGSSLSTTGNASSSINGAITGALNNNLAASIGVDGSTTLAVNTGLSGALNSGVMPGTAITNVVTSTINNGGNTSTAVASAVVTALSNGVNADTAITTALNAASSTNLAADTGTNLAADTGTNLAADTGANLAANAGTNIAANTGTNIAANTGTNLAANTGTNLAANTGTNLSVDTNISGNVTTAVVTDSNNNTSTTVINNPNTNTSTTIVINDNTGSSTTTTINNNTGTIVTEAIDTNSGLTINTVIDANTGTKVTTAIDTNTGVVVDVNTRTLVNTDIDTVTGGGGGGNDTLPGGGLVDTIPSGSAINITPAITLEPTPLTLTATPLTPTSTTQKTPTSSGGGGGALPSLLMGGTGPGALPGAISPTMLEGAPIEALMNLPQLMQLYPQLANVDQRLLQMLSGRGVQTSGSDAGTGNLPTALSMTQAGAEPSPGMPAKSVRTGSTPQTTDFLGSTGPLSGKLDPLTAAGLTALEKGIGYAKGGLSQVHQTYEHKPEFITGATGYYVKGRGDGQSDDIPAMLADGEYVFDADTVAALGNGSSDAGAKILDKMRENIRKHKRSAHHSKIPPKAKSPLEYLKG